MPQPLPIICGRCGHRAEIAMTLAALVGRTLRCTACDHRQSFHVKRQPRRPNGRAAREYRAAKKHGAVAIPFDDPLADLWAAG